MLCNSTLYIWIVIIAHCTSELSVSSFLFFPYFYCLILPWCKGPPLLCHQIHMNTMLLEYVTKKHFNHHFLQNPLFCRPVNNLYSVLQRKWRGEWEWEWEWQWQWQWQWRKGLFSQKTLAPQHFSQNIQTNKQIWWSKNSLLRQRIFFFQVRKRRCAWAGSPAIGLVVGFDADRVFCMYLVSHVVCLCYPVPLVPARKTPKKKENWTSQNVILGTHFHEVGEHNEREREREREREGKKLQNNKNEN